MKNTIKKLKSVAQAALEKQDEQLIRCFIFPFLFKKLFKNQPSEAEQTLQILFKASRELDLDLLFLLIEGLEGRYSFPPLIQDNLWDFTEVVEYTITQPLDAMDKVPSVLMEKARAYSADVMKKKLNTLL